MARLRLEPAGVELVLAQGERLLDVQDDHPQLGLPTACRAANCATCLVDVVAGEALLAPRSAREHDELQRRVALPSQRLGCQICIRGDAPDAGLIVLSISGRPSIE